MDSFEQDSAAFLDWFRRNEGTRVSDKICIADLRTQGAGRAVLATQDIAEDDELFALPKALTLHVQTSDLIKHLNRPLPDSDQWLSLTLIIIYECLRGQASPWALYLKLLPSNFDTLMFWSEEELEELKGSEVLHKIGRESAEDAWRETLIPVMLEHSELFPCSNESKEERTKELIGLAHRAGSLIMAYAFDIVREDIAPTADEDSAESSLVSDDEDDSTFKGMVPFADLLNADADRNNAKLFDEDDYLIMRAIVPIKAGDQVFNDYGPLPRSDLLRMYGYITPNYAQYDVVELLQSDITATSKNMKREITSDQSVGVRALDELGLLEDGYVIQRPSSDSTNLIDLIPAELHMLLRALTCNLGNDASSNEKRIQKGIKENLTIEEASLLASVCTKRLTDYPTSVEQDINMLQTFQTSAIAGNSSVSPHRLKMAIEVRKGEKEILHTVIGLCQAHITRRTSEIKNDGVGTKRKHQGEDGRATEKEKQKKKNKRDGFR
jgi:SET domain-containing protein 6